MSQRRDSDFVGDWDFIIGNWDNLLSTNRKIIIRSLRLGIPRKHRGEVWSRLLRGQKAKSSASFSYLELLQKPCRYCSAIERDIPDTVPGNNRGNVRDFEASLKNVLVAYANADEDLGYVHGMSLLVAMFLFYQPEETAFWSFYALMSCGSRPHRRFYLQECQELELLAELTSKLVSDRLPALRDVFTSDFNDVFDIVRHWFTSCFISSDFELEMNTFIFDQFLAYGSPPLLSFGLTVLSLNLDVFHTQGWTFFLDRVMNPGKSDIMHVRQRVNVEWGKQWITTAEFAAMLEEIPNGKKDPMVIIEDDGDCPDKF
jgi:hypothetical protein